VGDHFATRARFPAASRSSSDKPLERLLGKRLRVEVDVDVHERVVVDVPALRARTLLVDVHILPTWYLCTTEAFALGSVTYAV
jgi:hypothetical protein